MCDPHFGEISQNSGRKWMSLKTKKQIYTWGFPPKTFLIRYTAANILRGMSC